MPLSDKEAMKILLKSQSRYRREGKSTSWLQGYARGFLKTGEKLRKRKA